MPAPTANMLKGMSWMLEPRDSDGRNVRMRSA